MRSLRIPMTAAMISVLGVGLILRLLLGGGVSLDQRSVKDLSVGPFVKYHGGPVLQKGQEGSWDSGSIHAPSVVKVGQKYMMWYDGASGGDPYLGWSIGHARAEDGEGAEWAKHPANPVLTAGPPGTWDSTSVHDPRVVYEGGVYRMWYSGYDGRHWRIGYATSSDGVLWAKHPSNPVLSPGEAGDWDESGVAYSSVLVKDGLYRMWYQGLGQAGVWRIGYAVSGDGVQWQKSPISPVFSPGSNDDWDGQKVMTPQVIKIGAKYLMFYTGAPLWGIGYATSKDGILWQRTSASPIMAPGQGGGWDGVQILTLSVLLEGDALRVWYAGGSGESLGIGLTSSQLTQSAAVVQ